MEQELGIHCFSRYSTGLVGLVMGGLVVNQPDASFPDETPGERHTQKARRMRLALGSVKALWELRGAREDFPEEMRSYVYFPVSLHVL